MREAIGSSWLFYLVITFLLIYIFFMGFIMNYASAYRAANYVVTQIETCQAEDDCVGKDIDSIQSAIKAKYHYVVPNNQKLNICCITNGSGSVYRVTLPVEFDVPMLGPLRLINVRAETKTIVNNYCNNHTYGGPCRN